MKFKVIEIKIFLDIINNRLYVIKEKVSELGNRLGISIGNKLYRI